jgi:hypothetical protein
MRRDYKVEFRREEVIAAEAGARRVRARNETFGYFNVATFIRLGLPLDPKIGPISIVHDTTASDPPAFVTYKPRRTLHIDREIWELMDQGEPESRFVGAHEAGHLVLHDHRAQAFSGNPELQIKFAKNEYSAEWQADTFADHLLLPTRLVVAINNEKELMNFGVTGELVERRLKAVRTKPVLISRNPGDACTNCGNFSLAGTGLRLRCNVCFVDVERFSIGTL